MSCCRSGRLQAARVKTESECAGLQRGGPQVQADARVQLVHDFGDVCRIRNHHRGGRQLLSPVELHQVHARGFGHVFGRFEHVGVQMPQTARPTDGTRRHIAGVTDGHPALVVRRQGRRDSRGKFSDTHSDDT